MSRDPDSVDWVLLGRSILASGLQRHLGLMTLAPGLREDRFTLGWRVGSLLEVIHLQLFEHLQRHPDFGIGTCGYCGGPILRVRMSQRFHSGCAPAGRQRESRAARRAKASPGAGQ